MLRPLAAAVLATMLTTAQAQDNLLPNPGFETGAGGWTVYVNTGETTATGTPEATSTAVASAARTGTRGMQIIVSGVNGNNWDVQLQPPQTWRAEKGRVYHMTFWGRSLGSKPMTVAASLGPAGGYTYLEGWAMSLSPTWKQYEVFYKAPATGVDSLRLNVYVGADTGTYHFDDFVLDTVPSALPATMVQPARGAWYTGVYRNLFNELGYSQTAVDAKIEAAFQQLFVTGDSAQERLLYKAPADTTMAYIDNVAGFVLTEGQSYAMMVALQMDRKDLFDKLWKFAKLHMQQKTGDRTGYFAWKVSINPPYTPDDYNPAPDGEEYFLTALYFAAKRWGNGTGIFDYQAQADSLLGWMTKEKTATMLPLIVPDRKQIVFSPAQIDDPYTDPSYHLPAFSRVWDALATNRKGGFYLEMTDTSWALLKRAQHPTTGLFPEYSTFDGAPKATDFNAKSQTFASDAHRVASNIGFSWAWFQDDTGAMRMVKKQLGFFSTQTGGYKAEYTLEGVAQVDYVSQSLQAANATAVLASDNPADWAFVDALWKLPVASGEYRYYNGLIQMLNLLHVSGKFKAWGSPGLSTSVAPRAKGAASFGARMAGRDVLVTGIAGEVKLRDGQGRIHAIAKTADGAARLHLPGSGSWILDAGAHGARIVAAP